MRGFIKNETNEKERESRNAPVSDKSDQFNESFQKPNKKL